MIDVVCFGSLYDFDLGLGGRDTVEWWGARERRGVEVECDVENWKKGKSDDLSVNLLIINIVVVVVVKVNCSDG